MKNKYLIDTVSFTLKKLPKYLKYCLLLFHFIIDNIKEKYNEY